MTIRLDVEYGEKTAKFRALPQYGKRVTFAVIHDGKSFKVCLASRPASSGFSRHTTYEAACKAALLRARRYVKAYSVPRRMPRGAAA